MGCPLMIVLLNPDKERLGDLEIDWERDRDRESLTITNERVICKEDSKLNLYITTWTFGQIVT